MESKSIDITDLLGAGVHFGHQKKHWNPKMAPYIFGVRKNLHIIDVRETLVALREVENYVYKLVAENKNILFVGTKLAASKIIKEQAIRAQVPYINHRWLGGTLTNYKTINQSIATYNNLIKQRKEGLFEKLTKKEALKLTARMSKLENTIGGIRNMKGYPDALFVIDVKYEDIAVKEAQKLGIPIIGLVDTNSSPEGIDYVIPANDDAMTGIHLLSSYIADVIIRAKLDHNFYEQEDSKSEGKRSKRRVVSAAKEESKDSEKTDTNKSATDSAEVATNDSDNTEAQVSDADNTDSQVSEPETAAIQTDTLNNAEMQVSESGNTEESDKVAESTETVAAVDTNQVEESVAVDKK